MTHRRIARAVLAATILLALGAAPAVSGSREDLAAAWARLEAETRQRPRAEASEITRAFLDGITDADVLDACAADPGHDAAGASAATEPAPAFRRLLIAYTRHRPPDAATIVARLGDPSLAPDCHDAYLRAAQRQIDAFTDAEADAIARSLLTLSDARPGSSTDLERSAVAFGHSDAVLARLSTHLTSTRDADRRRGAELALESRDDRVGPLLVRLLEKIVHDPIPYAESLDAVAVAAAEQSGGAALPLLAQLIAKTSDWRIQRAGIVALGRTGEPRAYRVLARLYREAPAMARSWPSRDPEADGADADVGAGADSGASADVGGSADGGTGAGVTAHDVSHATGSVPSALPAELYRTARRLEPAGLAALRHGLVAEARDVVEVLDRMSREGPCVRPESVIEALKDYLTRDADADTERIRAIVERIGATR